MRIEVGIIIKFAAVVLIVSVAERTIPMAADDCLIGFDDAAVGGFYTVAPSRVGPHRFRGSTPFSEGQIRDTIIILDTPTRDPTMRGNKAPGLKIIDHCTVYTASAKMRFWHVLDPI